MPRRPLAPRALGLLALLAALAPAVRAQTPGSAVDQRRADPRDEVLYELFVRNATPEGTLRAAIPLLPDIRALGATTVWLMPVYPIGVANRKGPLGSPYSIRDYTAVNPELGTAADFRAFVAAAHGLGLKVILDWVANHTAWDHPWLAAHPDFYTKGPDGRPAPPVADWSDVVDLDYGNAALRDSMTAAMRYWLTEFDVDGFRCDVAEMVPQDFWTAAIADLRGTKPVLMLAEGQAPWLHAAGFDLTYDWHLYHAMKRVWKDGAPVGALAPILTDSAHAFPPDAVRMRFTTNHDETAWDRPPMFAFNGSGGAAAAFWTVALLPGAPLVYNGQEGGSTVNTGLFARNPLPAPDRAVREQYETALDLRTRYDVLRRGALTVHDAGPDVLLFERTLGAQRVLVAVNTRGQRREVGVPPALRAVYNGEGRRPTPVRVEEVLNTALGDGATYAVGSLAVPETAALGPYEVRTWGTILLRTR